MEFVIMAHVLLAIIFVGPLAVSTALFGGNAVKAAGGDQQALGVAKAMHRITNTYGMISLIVPAVGFIIFFTDLETYKSEGLMHASILLTIVAWAFLLFVIAPKQAKVLAALGDTEVDADAPADLDIAKAKGQLGMFGGIFSLLWLIVAVLMFLVG